MKNSILGRGLCALALSLAVTAMAADNSNTLFPDNQATIDIYGINGDGNVDTNGSDQKVFGTMTEKVKAPTTPTPPVTTTPPVITVTERPAFKTGITFRSAFATPTGDPETTTTTTVKTVHELPARHTDHNTVGGGIQAGWFFNRYFGVAAEGDFFGGQTFISAATGQLILRYPFDFGRKPIGPSGYSKDGKDVRSPKDSGGMSPPTWGLAPYFICGGGAQWDGQGLGIADVGGGVEVRCKANWGVFCDGRWIVHNEHDNYGAVRLGLAYSFQ